MAFSKSSGLTSTSVWFRMSPDALWQVKFPPSIASIVTSILFPLAWKWCWFFLQWISVPSNWSPQLNTTEVFCSIGFPFTSKAITVTNDSGYKTFGNNLIWTLDILMNKHDKKYYSWSVRSLYNWTYGTLLKVV